MEDGAMPEEDAKHGQDARDAEGGHGIDGERRIVRSRDDVQSDIEIRHDRLRRRQRNVLAVVRRGLIRRFSYTWDVPQDLPEQILLLSNHEAYLDPAMMFITFPHHSFDFLCGEQVFRKPLLGAIVRYLADPTPVMRQANDLHAVRASLSSLRNGQSVAFYPAGEREWDGHAMPVADSIGKFVKMAKVPLVTFNVEGMYFVNPRWGARMRHLPTHGRVIGVYDTDVLAGMSAGEVTELVRRDLAFDSTAWRARLDVATRGKDLACWLETVLYLCPHCEGVDTLHTHGDIIECECGFTARYTDRDVFSDDAPFHTVHEWNEWQRRRFIEMVDASHGSMRLSIEDARICHVEPAVTQTLVASGTLTFDENGISCGDWSKPLSEIRGFAPVESDRIILTVGEGHFEVCHERPWNVVAYRDLYNHLKATQVTAR